MWVSEAGWLAGWLTTALGLSVPALPGADGGPGAAGAARAEIAFSIHSVRRGMNDAFLAYFHPQAVDFAPHPRPNARASIAQRPPAPVTLSWYPARVESAASKDLAVSSGPYVLVSDESGAVSHGHYLSVWRRAGGRWRVAIDGGVSHPVPVEYANPSFGATPGVALQEPLSPDRVREESKTFSRLDASLTRAAADSGAAAAIRERAAADIRFYRDGMQPVDGVEAVVEAMAGLGGTWRWHAEGGGVAESGDLGYTYGTTERLVNDRRELGAYLRIWRRSSDGWRIVYNRDTPLPDED